MPKEESKTIEVEVVEIDGVTPPPATPHHEEEQAGRGAPWSNWQDWSGKVRKLDARWWPLWVILGVVVLGFVLTIGLILGVIYVIARLIRNFILGFFSLFSPVSSTELR